MDKCWSNLGTTSTSHITVETIREREREERKIVEKENRKSIERSEKRKQKEDENTR